MRNLLRALLAAVCCVGLVAALAGTASAGDKEGRCKVVKDIPYYNGEGADQEKNKVDLYLPQGKKNVPVLFFIHGGGWTSGTRSKFANLGKAFAAEGIAVVAAGYRLSPAVKHPEHIKDVARAFAWTQKNIKKYGGDPQNIFVSGHSAGGHLAALLCTDASYLKEHGLSLKDVRGCIPVSGVYEIRPGRKAVFSDDAEECKKASPLCHVGGDCPPFLILYAEKDGKNMDKMAQALCAALKKAEVQATCREMADRNHGSIVYNITGGEDPTGEAMISFIRKNARK